MGKVNKLTVTPEFKKAIEVVMQTSSQTVIAAGMHIGAMQTMEMFRLYLEQFKDKVIDQERLAAFEKAYQEQLQVFSEDVKADKAAKDAKDA